MPSVKAGSIAPAARSWLAHSREPRILHVFDQACNLINEHKDVLSVVAAQIGNGPFNLVLSSEVAFPGRLDAQSRILIRSDQLRLGGLQVDIGAAETWEPRPNWERLYENRQQLLFQISAARWIDEALRIPDSALSTLSAAVAEADVSAARSAAAQLAGLGPGLTPAGDDVMLGALLAAWIMHPPGLAKALGQQLCSVAAARTTSLSAAWLRSASRGEAGIRWHELFDALLAADGARVHQSVGAITAVGETSGADALAGFVGACMSRLSSASFKSL